MELELERGHNSEIAAPAAQGPQQVGIRRRIGANHCSVSRNDLSGDEIVDAQPEFSPKIAETAAEGETSDDCFRDIASRRSQAEELRLAIDVG